MIYTCRHLESKIVWRFAYSGRPSRKLLGRIVLFVCRILRASSRPTLSEADVVELAALVELAAPVALRRVEPGMRAGLVCWVEALVLRRSSAH